MNSSFMDIALEEARKASNRGEVPVGAVLTHNGEILSRAGNRTLELNDPSAHAEMMVIRDGCDQLASQRLPQCDLYVTLEPCTMCAAAISFARIKRLYFGAEDAKSGGIVSGVNFFHQPSCHHAPEVYSGIAESDSVLLLKDFFKKRR